MPRTLVTRKLPSSVIARLEEVSEVDLYTGSVAISREELLKRSAGVDAIVCLLTDAIDAAVLDAAGPQLKVVANVAVGYNNIDVACVPRAWHHRHEHAGCPDKRLRRLHLGTDPGSVTQALR